MRITLRSSTLAASWLGAVGLLLSVAACSTEKPRLPPGRCTVNGDCDEGFRCRDTYCEDIYYPRREIKPY